MKQSLLVLFLANAAWFSGVLPVRSDSGPEGVPVSNAELDLIVAAGCGQTASTNGNNNCTYGNIAACAENGVFPNFQCVNPGAENGRCWGAQNETCQGQIAQNGNLCVNLPAGACCSLNAQCSTLPATFTDEYGNQTSGTVCTSTAHQWPVQSTRTITNIGPDDSCKPIQY